MAEATVNPHGIHIDMSQFTNNVVKHTKDTATDEFAENSVSGTGIFDILMNTATKHLEAQYDAGRIKGEDYAGAYMQIYQATLQTAAQIWLQKPIAELQKESEEAKRELYYRQIQGLDEDYNQKMLKMMIDGWSVGFSVSRDAFAPGTGGQNVPDPMKASIISSYFHKIIVPTLNAYDYGRAKSTVRGPVSTAVSATSPNIVIASMTKPRYPQDYNGFSYDSDF